MRLYVLILIIGSVASFWGPWWILSPVCFGLCWWRSRHAAPAFWISAVGGISVWLAYTVYLHIAADVDLATKVAGIFLADTRLLTQVPGIVMMSTIAAAIIGLVSGFSGLAGLKMSRYVGRRSG